MRLIKEMIKNKIKINKKEHIYFVQAISVTQLVNAYLNKEISAETKKQPYFVKAQKFGENFHEFAEDIIKRIRHNTFNSQIFFDDLAKKLDLESLKIYGEFFKWITSEIVNFSNILVEKRIAGTLKTVTDHQLLICGTFDALDVRNKILFEWKTCSSTKEFESWKLQTRIYNHLLDYKIKKVVIYNPKINFYHEFVPKRLSQLEIVGLIDAGLSLLKYE